MAFIVSKIILHNRAPFEHTEIDFKDKGISVLSAVNGGGKTTVLSHIADAWYEMVRIAFAQEYEGKEGKYYRLSSPNFCLDRNKASVVYIRFDNNGKFFDYVDARNPCSQKDYESIVQLVDRIPYGEIKNGLDQDNNAKHLSVQDINELGRIFNTNVVTYFPAYRHERPGYLNTPFNIKFDYNLAAHFAGYLRNPVEVITGLPQLANWLMDVVLDKSMKDGDVAAKTVNVMNRLGNVMNKLSPDGNINPNKPIPKSITDEFFKQLNALKLSSSNLSVLFDNINSVFTSVLSVKSGKNVFLGIGSRNDGVTRIQIGERDRSGQWTKTVYPSIFNMSSGENAMICLFGEILRQFDNIMPNLTNQYANGVVLIDEIDKHLHIQLQTEVLPKLFSLFPNIQFIVSSHSPFVSMGLFGDAATKSRMELIDLDKNASKVDIASTQVFKEAYATMFDENERFKDLYEKLKAATKPILYVEDKIDKIYKIAWLKLHDVSFATSEIDAKFESNAPFIVESGGGAGGVAGLLNCDSSKVFEGKKIIGVFDYDAEGSEKFHHVINVKGYMPRDTNIQGNIRDGFYRKRNDHECMIALLLPVPERLDGLVTSKGDWDSDAKYANYVEIETLLSENFLISSPSCEQDTAPIPHYKAKDTKKQNLWQELVAIDKSVFEDFAPLFKIVYELFDIHINNNTQPLTYRGY